MKNNSIISVIDVIRSRDFYGVSDNMEIAKGRNQIVSNWKDAKVKIKRLIKAKR